MVNNLVEGNWSLGGYHPLHNIEETCKRKFEEKLKL